MDIEEDIKKKKIVITVNREPMKCTVENIDPHSTWLTISFNPPQDLDATHGAYLRFTETRLNSRRSFRDWAGIRAQAYLVILFPNAVQGGGQRRQTAESRRETEAQL